MWQEPQCFTQAHVLVGGKGRFVHASGDVYEGQWLDDKAILDVSCHCRCVMQCVRRMALASFSTQMVGAASLAREDAFLMKPGSSYIGEWVEE